MKHIYGGPTPRELLGGQKKKSTPTRSKALEKKRENPYDKAFRAGKIPPHQKPSKEMKRFIDGK